MSLIDCSFFAAEVMLISALDNSSRLIDIKRSNSSAFAYAVEQANDSKRANRFTGKAE
ncbi:hypothetical protein GCM10007086_27780 [Photobacterium aphoticum]|nr:hypothetical protein GCM10007086_27780 [Photobacterium aphoticum]